MFEHPFERDCTAEYSATVIRFCSIDAETALRLSYGVDSVCRSETNGDIVCTSTSDKTTDRLGKLPPYGVVEMLSTIRPVQYLANG